MTHLALEGLSRQQVHPVDPQDGAHRDEEVQVVARQLGSLRRVLGHRARDQDRLHLSVARVGYPHEERAARAPL